MWYGLFTKLKIKWTLSDTNWHQIAFGNIIYIKDSDVINLNNITIKVITTPGHTNCSVVYQIEDSMFTGDTLFNDGVGRTDLPTSNTVQLINSLKKLLDNNNQKTIYPGHGNPSTLDEERKHNDFYRRTR